MRKHYTLGLTNNMSSEIKMTFLYRYCSLAMTSVFYLIGDYDSTLINKFTVVGCLIVASTILNYIYKNYINVKNVIRWMVIIETISNVIILIPTGGINSPYIWYSLNTVLIIACFLNESYFYFNLFTYTAILSIATFYIFNTTKQGMLEFLRSNSNLILSYTLIIVAIQILMKLTKKLRKEGGSLVLINDELTARLERERINKQLLVAEEQNRIANEIHDNVSQRLFYISCKLNSLMQKNGDNGEIDLKDELEFIQKSLKNTMQQLREAIYNYSNPKSEPSIFEESITKYIEEISRLNGIKISFVINGEHGYMSYRLKHAMYRIISECIGNAIRHGRSENITVNLSIYEQGLQLNIDDDGVGFNFKSKISNGGTGLGIRNMHNLVHSFGGNMSITSELNKGTSIKVSIPIVSITARQEEVV